MTPGNNNDLPKVAPPSSAAGSSSIRRRTRGYLPHWEREAGVYFITFRLADALPEQARHEILEHRATLAQARRGGRELLPVESVTAHRLTTAKIEAYLDAGVGECLLRHPKVADLVTDTLYFGDGKRYRLEAWCVMPNHVHVLCQLSFEANLAKVVAGWKSVSARRINALLRRRGAVWQREYYDHLIRNSRELDRAKQYIRDNPIRAGLKNWKWVYVRDARGPAAGDGGATTAKTSPAAGDGGATTAKTGPAAGDGGATTAKTGPAAGDGGATTESGERYHSKDGARRRGRQRYYHSKDGARRRGRQRYYHSKDGARRRGRRRYYHSKDGARRRGRRRYSIKRRRYSIKRRRYSIKKPGTNARPFPFLYHIFLTPSPEGDAAIESFTRTP